MNKINDKLNVRIIRILCFFVLITCFFSACESKKKVEVKNNAGVVIESFFVDKKAPDVKIGVYNKYYDDGKILEVANYKDGKLNGERTLYYPDGKIMQKENYVDNKYEGKLTAYYEDGSLQQEGFYKDNMMNGVWKNYSKEYKNVLKDETTMKDNKIDGLYKEYYPNGKLFAEGNKIQLTEELDVFDGKVQVYDSLGNLEKILIYEKGKQINKEEVKK